MKSKGPRKRGNIVGGNMLPSMFPCLRANETFVAETIFVSEKQKKFFLSLIFFQKYFVSATNVSPFAPRGNNVDWILWSS